MAEGGGGALRVSVVAFIDFCALDVITQRITMPAWTACSRNHMHVQYMTTRGEALSEGVHPTNI